MTTPDRLAETLKPCPFCGREAEIRGVTVTKIQCTNDQCISSGAFNDFGHRHDAIEAWNRRATATPVPGAMVLDALSNARDAAFADSAFLRSSLAPAEAVTTEPVAEVWQFMSKDGRWKNCFDEAEARIWEKEGRKIRALYTAPTGDSGALREALEKIATLNRSRDQLQEIARAALASGEKAR